MAQGAWHDLSHPLGSTTPVPHVPPELQRSGKYGFPTPTFERFRSMPEFPANITRIDMVAHVGTHVDAPNHFISDGPAFDEIPLDRLYGMGRVAKLDCEPCQIIGAVDIARICPDLRCGEILVLDTGWSRYAQTVLYDEHPSLDEGAAIYLREIGIKLLAVDFPSPDMPIAKRSRDFAWPVHHVLLSHGILVAENLRLDGSLPPGPAEFYFLALNIEGADGAPARVIGRSVKPF